MKVNITELLTIFDKTLTPPTNEEQGEYWFEATLPNNLTVTLTFSIYECYVSILIGSDADVAITSIRMKNCLEIRLLDIAKKSFEIIHNGQPGRCFLQLTGDTILSYDE
ncbi:MAG: hypothetical protein KDK71_02960 [Chlamydiia bacterium]|nr:hypothetical protein [Chlamydiia bacterium]